MARSLLVFLWSVVGGNRAAPGLRLGDRKAPFPGPPTPGQLYKTSFKALMIFSPASPIYHRGAGTSHMLSKEFAT